MTDWTTVQAQIALVDEAIADERNKANRDVRPRAARMTSLSIRTAQLIEPCGAAIKNDGVMV